MVAAQWVRSQKALKDYEPKLKTTNNLFGEAQGEQLWEAALPGTAAELSAAELV